MKKSHVVVMVVAVMFSMVACGNNAAKGELTADWKPLPAPSTTPVTIPPSVDLPMPDQESGDDLTLCVSDADCSDSLSCVDGVCKLILKALPAVLSGNEGRQIKNPESLELVDPAADPIPTIGPPQMPDRMACYTNSDCRNGKKCIDGECREILSERIVVRDGDGGVSRDALLVGENVSMSNLWCLASANRNCKIFYRDYDGDGYGSSDDSIVRAASLPIDGYSINALDCDDKDRRVHPGSKVPENLNSQKDFNCDGIYFYLPKYMYYGSAMSEFSFDPDRRVLTQKDRSGLQNSLVISSTEIFLDSNGNPLIEKYHENGDLDSSVSYSFKRQYDSEGRVVLITKYDGDIGSPVNNSVEFRYDSHGNKTSKIVHYSFNDNFDGCTVSSWVWQYDSYGNKLTERDYCDGDINTPVNNTMEWTYDIHGNKLTERRYYDGNAAETRHALEWLYDTDGNMIGFTQWAGDLSQGFERHEIFSYNSDGKKLTRSLCGSSLESSCELFRKWEYDSNGYVAFEINMNVNLWMVKWVNDEHGNILTYSLRRYGSERSEIDTRRFEEYVPVRQPIIFDDDGRDGIDITEIISDYYRIDQDIVY